jgi:hypothetical protein
MKCKPKIHSLPSQTQNAWEFWDGGIGWAHKVELKMKLIYTNQKKVVNAN